MKNAKRKNTKIKLPGELIYFVAVALLSLSVAILTSTGFGVSMIVAPAYLLSLKLGIITFGQAEYIVQACLFILLCLVLRRFRFAYLMSFVTCLFYGFVLDLWRRLPCFDSAVTPPGSMALGLRILLYVLGVLLTAFSIALFFKTYFYPQLYDFFVKAVSHRYQIKVSRFKTCFDLTCLSLSILLTFCFFGRFVGISWGTFVMALINGSIIGFFSNLLDQYFEFPPLFRSFAAFLDLDKE